jgi:hypothetical protein
MDLSTPSILRTSAAMQKIIADTAGMGKNRKDKFLKAAGLRDVEVCILLLLLDLYSTFSELH